MIELLAASKIYDKVTGLSETTLNIASGESVAVIGENGAGKTTLLRLISGILKPTTGSVQVGGVTPTKRHSTSLGIVGEELALKETFKVCTYLNIFYKLSQNARNADFMATIQALEVDSLLHKRIKKLSRGQRKRVALVRAFLCADRLLLLDEPFSGLDPGQVINLRNLITSVSADGKTVILNSHDLAELGTVAQRVIVLRRGEIRYDGYLKNIKIRQLWSFQMPSLQTEHRQILRSLQGVVHFEVDGQSLLIEVSSQTVVKELVDRLQPLTYNPISPMEQIYRLYNVQNSTVSKTREGL
jgi:ABC-2 type transport system ATP-binding protein